MRGWRQGTPEPPGAARDQKDPPLEPLEGVAPPPPGCHALASSSQFLLLKPLDTKTGGDPAVPVPFTSLWAGLSRLLVPKERVASVCDDAG